MSHLSKVMKRCFTVTSLSLRVPQRQDMGAHPASLRDARGIRAGTEPVGMDNTVGESPDFKRGDGKTITSLLLLIYDRSDTLCAVARGFVRMSLS